MERGLFSDTNNFTGTSLVATGQSFELLIDIVDWDAVSNQVLAASISIVNPGTDGYTCFINVNGLNLAIRTGGVTFTFATPLPLSNANDGKTLLITGVIEATPGGMVRLYVNGAEVGVGVAIVGTLAAPVDPLFVGWAGVATASAEGVKILYFAGTNQVLPPETVRDRARGILSRTTNLVVPTLPGAPVTWIYTDGTTGGGLVENGVVPSGLATIDYLKYSGAIEYAGDSLTKGFNDDVGGFISPLSTALQADGYHYTPNGVARTFKGPIPVGVFPFGEQAFAFPSTTIEDFLSTGPDPLASNVAANRAHIVGLDSGWNNIRGCPLVNRPTLGVTMEAAMNQLIDEIVAAAPWAIYSLWFMPQCEAGDFATYPSEDLVGCNAFIDYWNFTIRPRIVGRNRALGRIIDMWGGYANPARGGDHIHFTGPPGGYNNLVAPALASIQRLKAA